VEVGREKVVRGNTDYLVLTVGKEMNYLVLTVEKYFDYISVTARKKRATLL
jgi:hypothetical protein